MSLNRCLVVHRHLNWQRKLLILLVICMLLFLRDTHGDTRRCLLWCFWPISRWLKRPSRFVAQSPTNGSVIVANPLKCRGVVITTTPSMDQSISGPIISFLTFEEPSSHSCGDDAGAVWQLHHTEAFLPFPRASTTPDQGSGHQVAPSSSGIGRGYFRSQFLYIDAYGFSSGSGMNPCSLSDLITPRIR